MPRHDIIVIGASAGGIEALREVVGGFPGDLAAAVFVVVHLPPQSTSILPDILTRAGRLRALHPKDGDAAKPGRIYVAPPDHHLLVHEGRIKLTRGPRENRSRPAIDPLFRSAALEYGARVIGVILSGTLDDGTAGLLAVKRRGGVAVVQDPAEALYPGMPRSALENVAVDHVVGISALGGLLVRLTAEPAPPAPKGPPEELAIEAAIPEAEGNMRQVERLGRPSVYSCPECHGILFEIADGDLLRFRCQVGHSYSAESLSTEQESALEGAMWAALRALEENVLLTKRLAARSREHGHERTAAQFDRRARDTEQQAALIRQALHLGKG